MGSAPPPLSRAAIAALSFSALLAGCGGGGGATAGTATTTPAVAATMLAASATAAGATAVSAVETAASASGVERSSWHTYHDASYGFTFAYPGEIRESAQGLVVGLPQPTGTTLLGKALFVTREKLSSAAGPCRSKRAADRGVDAAGAAPVSINGVVFRRWTDLAAGGGSLTQWEDYWTMRAGTCVVFDFTLTTGGAGFVTPPPVFDDQRETGVFASILATFRWDAP